MRAGSAHLALLGSGEGSSASYEHRAEAKGSFNTIPEVVLPAFFRPVDVTAGEREGKIDIAQG